MGFWHGYLSLVRCRFACGPADTFSVLAHWVVQDKGPLTGVVVVLAADNEVGLARLHRAKAEYQDQDQGKTRTFKAKAKAMAFKSKSKKWPYGEGLTSLGAVFVKKKMSHA